MILFSSPIGIAYAGPWLRQLLSDWLSLWIATPAETTGRKMERC